METPTLEQIGYGRYASPHPSGRARWFFQESKPEADDARPWVPVFRLTDSISSSPNTAPDQRMNASRADDKGALVDRESNPAQAEAVSRNEGGLSRVRPLDVDALRTELDIFELRYETPSDRLVEAFIHSGELIETDDFLRWSFIYSVLRRRSLV